MKQIIILCLLAICIPSESFGEGIFGLKKGMTLKEIKKLEFGYIKQLEDDPTNFFVEQPKKPEGSNIIFFVVKPEIGLLKIRFFWMIETNPYGDELKRKFNELESILSKKYGEGDRFDFLKTDSIWDEPKDYMRSLENSERELAWYSTDIPDSNKWELEHVAIVAGVNKNPMLVVTRGLFEGFVTLDYEFQGWSDYLNRQNSQF